MNILNVNEAAMSKQDPAFLEGYQKVCGVSDLPIGNVVLESAADESKIMSCVRGEHSWRLNSMEEPEKAAEAYAQRYSKLQDYSILCVFGISDGRAARRLVEHCNGTQQIIIYEPNLSVFMTAVRNFSLEDLLENEQVVFIVEGINGHDLDKALSAAITYQNRNLIERCILPNYDILYPEALKKYEDAISYFIKAEVFNMYSETQQATYYGDNLMMHMPYILQQSSVNLLLESFQRAPLGKIPAIIIAAGPSLDKNISVLKQAEGKAFLIGLDSALKALAREGIHINLAVCIDPCKNPNVFSDDRVHDHPYLAAGCCLPLVAQKNRNRLFYEAGYGFDAFADIISEETGKELGDLRTGGSVSTDAFSMVLEMGFQNVIFVGQDMAFTEGKGHVKGFELSEEADQAHIASRTRVSVEAYGGGGFLSTDIQMASYREWFESRIADVKDQMKVYNATEGGARIQGTIELTLQEAVDSLCVEEFDFDRLIREVPYTFDLEEQKVLCNKFLKSADRIQMLQKAIQEGIDAYDRLIYLEDNNMQSDPEYREVVKKVYKVNDIEENEKYMGLIKLYAKKSEYETADDIYEAEDLSVKDIAERGKQMLEGYLEGCRVCLERAGEKLLPGLERLAAEW